jgi:hypothetical protein
MKTLERGDAPLSTFPPSNEPCSPLTAAQDSVLTHLFDLDCVSRVHAPLHAIRISICTFGYFRVQGLEL